MTPRAAGSRRSHKSRTRYRSLWSGPVEVLVDIRIRTTSSNKFANSPALCFREWRSTSSIPGTAAVPLRT